MPDQNPPEIFDVGKTQMTSYRLLVTTPDRKLLVIPLPELRAYSFSGVKGSWQAFFSGSTVTIETTRFSVKWAGPQLENLHFSLNHVVEGVLRLQAWKELPPEALASLGLTRAQIAGGS